MKTGKMKTSKMKTSINLKTRKMKNNYLKLVMMAAVMLSASIGFAQTAPADAATNAGIQKDAGAGESVRVIDNKGTIKYLQTNNGITSITSTNSGSKTTTTWQLGGLLTDNTYIDASGAIFAIDGIALAAGAASTDAATNDLAGTTGTGVGTGYTFLVRDEATGATQKLKLEDLITSAYNETAVNTAFIGAPTITFSIALPTELEKIWVYRNGVKLRSGVDYTISGNNITITPIATATPAVGDWALYVGDFITVQVLSF